MWGVFMENWRKCVLYDFLNNLYETEQTTLYDSFYGDDKDKMRGYIDNYIMGCFYDYQDNEEIENFTLEEMENFLVSVFI